MKLPRVSLGLWQNFGDKETTTDIPGVLCRAFDLGVTHFDLANNYGPPAGTAEINFGKVLAREFAAYRDEMVIATKAGYYMWAGPYGDLGSRKYLISSLDQSLKRMGLEYVDIFYHHRMDPETPLEETMGALSSVVKSGKALYVGISNYSPERTREAAKLLREMGTPCLIHQPSYSMFNRWIEDGLTEVLREEGIGCIPFSPLAQGMLTNRYLESVPADSRAARGGFLKPETVEKRLPQIKALAAIAERRGQSLAQLALAWVLRLPEITTVLIGASRVSQLEDNLKAMDNLAFSPQELAEIEAVLAQSA